MYEVPEAQKDLSILFQLKPLNCDSVGIRAQVNLNTSRVICFLSVVPKLGRTSASCRDLSKTQVLVSHTRSAEPQSPDEQPRSPTSFFSSWNTTLLLDFLPSFLTSPSLSLSSLWSGHILNAGNPHLVFYPHALLTPNIVLEWSHHLPWI